MGSHSIRRDGGFSPQWDGVYCLVPGPPPCPVQNIENKGLNLRLCARSLSLPELRAKSREHGSYGWPGVGSRPVLGLGLELDWARQEFVSQLIVCTAGAHSFPRRPPTACEAVTKFVPSAKADSVGSTFAFPALPCRANECRRFATEPLLVPPS